MALTTYNHFYATLALIRVHDLFHVHITAFRTLVWSDARGGGGPLLPLPRSEVNNEPNAVSFASRTLGFQILPGELAQFLQPSCSQCHHYRNAAAAIRTPPPSQWHSQGNATSRSARNWKRLMLRYQRRDCLTQTVSSGCEKCMQYVY